VTDPAVALMSNAPERQAPLGRVAAPPEHESTSGTFYFWVDRDKGVERTQIVSTRSTVDGRDVRFVGIVQEVYRRSRQKDVHEEAARFDGRSGERPPFDSDGVTYAEAAVLSTTPVAHTPPTEESEVYLGGPPDVAEGYGLNRVREENRLAVGRVRNGGVPFAGSAVLDLAYLLGENGGHLNVNGIAGMGAKSSFLLHVIQLLLAWSRRTGRPGDPSRGRVVPIIFNVKNFDLFFIDRWNKNWKPEYAADWRELGIEQPAPFRDVDFRAPQERKSDNPIRTNRDGVTAYSWGLADIIELGLFRYLFADDDLGSPNFGTLVGAIEERLTFDSHDGLFLWKDGPQTFDDLLDWIRNPDNHHDLGEPHLGTKGSVVRRLRGLLQDCDGVLRRDQSRGKPLVVPTDETPGPLVIDLFGIRDEKLKRFVVAAVLHRLVELRSRDPIEGLRYVVALDELNRFAPKNGSDPITAMIEKVAAEMRSQGVILLGAQQEASRVSPRVIENCGIKAIGRSGTLELSADIWKFLTKSDKDHAAQLLETDKLLVQPSFRAPLLAKIPFPPWALRKEESLSPPAPRTAPGGRFAADVI